MDIGSKAPYPASTLSNFAPHRFELDGVQCASMEGLLQAFKFDKPHVQVEVCRLTGLAAKKRGGQRDWRRTQTLWWAGHSYRRSSDDYQRLLDRAFDALYTNDRFRAALVAAGNAVFTHSRGKNKASETVLTNREFCSRLTQLRDQAVRDSRRLSADMHDRPAGSIGVVLVCAPGAVGTTRSTKGGSRVDRERAL